MSMYSILAIAGGLLLLAYLLNPKAFGRIWEAAGALMGRGGKAVWSSDPEAIFEKRTDDAANELKDAVGGLEDFQANVSTMQAMVNAQESEKRLVIARIKTHLAAGREGEAAKEAVLLQKLEAKLSANSNKLADFQASYQGGLRKVKLAKDKIVQMRQEGKDLGAELKMSKAEAALSDAAQKINMGGPNLEGLGEIREEINAQIAKNRVKGQVARDLGLDGMHEVELEEQVAKEQAGDVLARFRAEMEAGKA